MIRVSGFRSSLVLAAGGLLIGFAAISIPAQNQQSQQGGANQQAQQGGPPPGGGGGGMHVTSAPKNLRLLPKDTSIDQLDKTMQEWKASLGGHCFTCHNGGMGGPPGGGPPGGGQMGGPPSGNQAQAGGAAPGGGQGQAGAPPQGQPGGGQGQPGGGQMGGPQGGPPNTDFTDGSKAEYKTAVRMYTMLQEINKKYLAESKSQVACGTCHRGHETPEAFVAQVTNQGPPPQGGQQGAPQGQAAPAAK